MRSIIAVQSPRCLEMPANDPYNEEVRRCFETPVHAGDVEGEYPEVLVADVSESAKGSRLVVSAGVEDGMVAEIRFRAFGCPHLVAAAGLQRAGKRAVRTTCGDWNERTDGTISRACRENRAAVSR